MDSWYYDLSEIKNSPSFRDGIDNVTESKSRTEAAKFISKLGQMMKLRYVTIATATVYMHRFYMHHSFKAFHRNAVATACLFLAGKVEETPKKARDFFKTIQAHSLIAESSMSLVFGADPKEELMTMERILLKTIKFDLQVDHPYKFVIKYAKTFIGERSRIEKVVQNCWGFINDSMGTTLCLQWEPEVVAIALMDLSCRITKYDITDWNSKPSAYKGKWWDQFVVDVSVDLLESICHQVLDLYQNVTPGSQEKPAATTSAKSGPLDSSKRPAPPDESVTPPGKQQRVEQPPTVGRSTQSVTHSTVPPTSGPPPQLQYQQPQHPVYQDQMPPGVSTGYTAPPPGYGGYAGQPNNMVRPPPPTNYQHPAYYSQPGSTNPQQAAMYYSQPTAGTYQGYAPSTNNSYASSMQPQQRPAQRRSSSLKVLTDNR